MLIITRIIIQCWVKDRLSGINGSFGSSQKKLSINFSEAKTKLRLRLLYNGDNNYFFVDGKTSLSLKPIIRMSTFQLNFVSEAYLMDLMLLILELIVKS